VLAAIKVRAVIGLEARSLENLTVNGYFGGHVPDVARSGNEVPFPVQMTCRRWAGDVSDAIDAVYLYLFVWCWIIEWVAH